MDSHLALSESVIPLATSASPMCQTKVAGYRYQLGKNNLKLGVSCTIHTPNGVDDDRATVHSYECTTTKVRYMRVTPPDEPYS